MSSLASQPYFSLFPVGGARGREKYPGTDCSTTLTSGGAIPSPSAQGDYPVREGVWFTRLRPVPEAEAVHVCVSACCKTERCEVLLALVLGRRTLCRPVALLLRSRSAGLLSAIVIR